ncbi:hypothetical protein M2387_002837 [Klebsiella sp. BIGb0407]|nr:hypothetical protein [Klebsiella sp. BIGb0407]
MMGGVNKLLLREVVTQGHMKNLCCSWLVSYEKLMLVIVCDNL